MKVYATKPLPSTQELVEILNQCFAGRYSSKLFGLGRDKTIMVRQSPVASTQISIRDNEITVQGMPSVILSVLGVTEAAFILVVFMPWLWHQPWKKMEKEVAVFLHEKYK